MKALRQIHAGPVWPSKKMGGWKEMRSEGKEAAGHVRIYRPLKILLL